MKHCVLVLTILAALIFKTVHAQHAYIKKCEGAWAGTMYMYKHGQLRDSVSVKLTISPKVPDAWTWRTEYLSPKMPMTKDYVMRVQDASKNIYVTDEGGGVLLTTYLSGAKLYSVFETGGYMLTSTYECRGDAIIFEVTSGKKETASHPEINNYSVDNLQRVVLRR